MSQFGDIEGVLETHWRTAVPTLAAGEAGVERRAAVGQDESSMPHVYLFNPRAPRRRRDGGVLEGVVEIENEIWTRDESQEQVASYVDAFRAELLADPTLGGLVIDAWVSFDGVLDAESLGRPERIGAVVVSALVEE